MANGDIPPVEQSIAGIIDLHHQIAEAHTPQGTGIGKIISPPPDIEIAWNDIILKKERIYIDEYLLKGHMREAMGQIMSATQFRMGGFMYGQYDLHNHDLNNPFIETLILKDTLKEGDLVEVTPLKGDQLFIVKCKLVYLGRGDGFSIAKNALSPIESAIQDTIGEVIDSCGLADILDGSVLNALSGGVMDFISSNTGLGSIFQNLTSAIAPLQGMFQDVLSNFNLPNIGDIAGGLLNNVMDSIVSNPIVSGIIQGGLDAIGEIQNVIQNTLGDFDLTTLLEPDKLFGELSDTIINFVTDNTGLGDIFQNVMSVASSMQDAISDVLGGFDLSDLGNLPEALLADLPEALLADLPETLGGDLMKVLRKNTNLGVI
ncbi:MAG: DUF2577 family protein, partial [Bacteroidales bacterium]|nr:DUF2577 family protein [Bacteroidales bacterium]